MADLELTRSQHDRKLYTLGDVGSLRLGSWFARKATAEAGNRTWEFASTGFWGRTIHATDEGGALVGEFEPRAIHRGGALRWGGRDYVLRPSSAWRERYVLEDGERELALLDGKGWGKRPVRVTLTDPAIEPGLLLFATFVVRGLAEDASSAAGGAGASTAAMGGSC